jgi:hypothetical protein
VTAPEPHLVDPVRLPEECIGQPECLEHLDRAAGDTVGLADFERALSALDDADIEVGEGGELCAEHGTCRPGSDNEHVDLGGNLAWPVQRLGGRRHDIRITRAVSIAVELHD